MNEQHDTQFSRDIKAWIEKTKAKLRLTNEEVILTVAGKLVERSPVGDPATWDNGKGKPFPKGYFPGTFKANWVGGFNEVNYTVTDEYDPSGTVSIVNISAVIPSDPTGVFYITNSLPYAQALEDGHSKFQAPLGIVGLTVIEFDEIAAASILKIASL
jgi:hypothetical protein